MAISFVSLLPMLLTLSCLLNFLQATHHYDRAVRKPFKPEEFCLQPLTKGDCDLKLPRYYYNKTEHQCLQFTYSGCNGNYNNFQSIDECIVFCRPTPTHYKDPAKICTLPKISGPCRAKIDRFWYNSQTNKCELFVYGGCQGNQNNFDTNEECEQTCVSNPAEKAKKFINHSNNSPPSNAPMSEIGFRSRQAQPISSSGAAFSIPAVPSLPSLPHQDHFLQMREIERQHLHQTPLFNFDNNFSIPFLVTSQLTYADAVRTKVQPGAQSRSYINDSSYLFKADRKTVTNQPNPTTEDLENPGFTQARRRDSVHLMSEIRSIQTFNSNPNCELIKYPNFICPPTTSNQLSYTFNRNTKMCEPYQLRSSVACGVSGNIFAFAQDCLIHCNAKGLSVGGVNFVRSDSN